MGDLGRHLIHGSSVHIVHNPNSISIGSAVFSGLTIVTNRQTDNRQTDRLTDRLGYWVCNNRPHTQYDDAAY